MVLRYVTLLWITCGVGFGQTPTTLNLASQARDADFSSFSFTRPISVGPALPSSCQVGQLFYNSAAAAGTNLYGCGFGNTWAIIGGYTLTPAGSNSLGGVIVTSNSGLTVATNGALSANLGSGTGTVAAGNDPRIVNALQPGSLIPAGNITGLARSATTDTTNAFNITSGILSSALLPGTIPSSTTGNAATATAFAATPSGCSTNQYATAISANGSAICAQVGYSQVSGTPRLYNQMLQVGGTAQTQRVNLNFAAGPNVTITPSDNGTNTTTLTLSASGGINSVNAGAPINSNGGANPTISCPTCATGSTSFTNYALIVGQGAQALTPLASTGNTTQVLHGNVSGLPSWSAVNLAADVTGKLPSASVSGLAASATTDTTNAANVSSGTLNPARIPTPSVSTLGGIESYVAPLHQWINSISTAGVPSSSQPAFGDIAGSLTASQLPPLTGDTTTSAGSTVTITSRVNGTSVPANSASDQTIITTSAAIGSWASLPSCLDSSGNHLNYNISTHTFSCGNTGGTAGSAAFSSLLGGTNTQAVMLVGTGANLAPTGSGSITANNYSGTLPPASLPAPTPSTLGGIESYTAPSHQWVNAVSIVGVPSSSQPAASDIIGLAPSATTDTTNASNISSGTLSASRLPLSVVQNNQVNTYSPGMKQTFSASVSTAGEGFAGVTVDPSTLAAGDRWFRADTKRMRVYDGSATQSVAWLSDVTPTIMTFDAFFPMGSCPASGTPALAWDAPASGTGAAAAGCSGTNVNQAYASFANSGTPALLRTFTLPPSFITANGADIYVSYLTPTAGGTFTLTLDVTCTASNGTTTNDPAFAANNFFAPGTQTAPGTANEVQTITVTGIPWPSGCTANSLAHMRLIRTDATGTATSVLVAGVTLVGRRTL